jgi:hypothetical protein
VTAGAYQLFGGDAADDAKFSRTFVFLDGEVLSNAAVSLEILSEKPLGVGVSHGWKAKRMSELIDAVLAYSGISMERPIIRFALKVRRMRCGLPFITFTS